MGRNYKETNFTSVFHCLQNEKQIMKELYTIYLFYILYYTKSSYIFIVHGARFVLVVNVSAKNCIMSFGSRCLTELLPAP